MKYKINDNDRWLVILFQGLKNEKDEIDREVVAKRAAATEAEKKYEDIRVSFSY